MNFSFLNAFSKVVKICRLLALEVKRAIKVSDEVYISKSCLTAIGQFKQLFRNNN